MTPGVSVRVGNRDLVVPPLCYSDVRRFSIDGTFEKVDRVAAGQAPSDLGREALAAVEAVVLAALRRNYPELGPDQLASLLDQEIDWGRSLGLILAAMRAATFQAKEATAKGER